MTIAYDLRYACDHFVGIGTYAFALLDALLGLPGDDRYAVLWDPRQAATRFDLAPLRSHPRVTWHERPWAPLGLRPLHQVGAWLRRTAPDAYLSPFHFLPLRPGCACVLTVHDVRPLRFPGELPPWRRLPYRAMLGRALRARFVTTVSDFSRAELIELVGADPARVRTVRPGVQPGLRRVTPERPAGAPDAPFALVVGDNRPHKNLRVLAQAWARLGSPPPLELVGAGPVDARHPDLAALVAEARVRATHLGRVSEAGLAWLYAHARLLLFPSRFEGFGSPLAEAFDLGVPAVVSDIPPFREIGAGAARLVAPDRPEAWAEAVAGLAADGAERARMAAAGREVAAGLTYARTADGVRALLREAVEGGRAA